MRCVHGYWVLLFAEGEQLPFDVRPLRAMPYHLTTEGVLIDVETTKTKLTERFQNAKAAQEQLFIAQYIQLVEGFPDIQRIKTDVFRERVRYSSE